MSMYAKAAILLAILGSIAGAYFYGMDHGEEACEAHYAREISESNDKVTQRAIESRERRISALERQRDEYAEQARQAQEQAEQRAAELRETRQRLEDVYENDSDARDWRNTPVPDSVRRAADPDENDHGDGVQTAPDTTGMRRPLPPRRRAPDEWAAPRELAGAA